MGGEIDYSVLVSGGHQCTNDYSTKGSVNSHECTNIYFLGTHTHPPGADRHPHPQSFLRCGHCPSTLPLPAPNKFWSRTTFSHPRSHPHPHSFFPIVDHLLTFLQPL